ncbi:C40 family peptidase [Kangiella geojedonensis]|uniref:NLP/P60 protein n=1 Tax=Kangiella geojedonensis TaxID=914150 RepID=A0A0F6RC99_9GAMM|nr:C40 family peptidase [Kangiella geojedonensis]AKE51831.1 NLP/P60 protein [Kangiella geojedonensis]
MTIKQLHTFTQLTILATVILVLSSCASTPRKTQQADSSRDGAQQLPPSKNTQGDKGLTIAHIAESMVGVDYRYGGSHPDEGFDCSGLVFYSHTQVGEQVPRVSYAQLAASYEVDKEDIKPGDLLFYRINGKPSHVGIYIGHGQFVHAPSSGKKVRVSSVENVYFKPRFIRAGRLYTNDD